MTPFVILAGFAVLWFFVRWQDYRTRHGLDPLVQMRLFSIRPLRSGIECFFSQNLILLGILFILPLYLQIVLGYDALETGVKMLPISITMFITSSSGPLLEGLAFGLALALLGVAMRLIASQLGNVIQSAVGPEDRGEAGGLQYTAQQLGSATGTALIGAIVLSALVGAFVDNIASDPTISSELSSAIEVDVAAGASFVAADDVEVALLDAGVDDEQTAAIVGEYGDAQLEALKAGLLLAGFLAACSLAFTGNLPGKEPEEPDEPDGAGASGRAPATA